MKTFLRNRLASFGFAFKGLRQLFLTQANAWIHLAVLVIVVFIGILLSCTPTEWAVLMLTFGVVIAAEAFNSSIEYLTDLISPAYHPLAGKVKDLAAAAVLICSIAAIGVGLFIFLPKLIALLT